MKAHSSKARRFDNFDECNVFQLSVDSLSAVSRNLLRCERMPRIGNYFVVRKFFPRPILLMTMS